MVRAGLFWATQISVQHANTVCLTRSKIKKF